MSNAESIHNGIGGEDSESIFDLPENEDSHGTNKMDGPPTPVISYNGPDTKIEIVEPLLKRLLALSGNIPAAGTIKRLSLYSDGAQKIGEEVRALPDSDPKKKDLLTFLRKILMDIADARLQVTTRTAAMEIFHKRGSK